MKGGIYMKAISKKVLITLGVILTLGLCVGCDPFEDSSISSSEYSSSSSSETQYFEIKWVNYGNKLIYKEMVPEGQMPFYRGETPTRPDTEEHTYVFTGWSPEVVPATADAKYKAQYETKKRTFDVVFSGGNCTCRYSQTIIKDVPYGTKVHTDGAYIEINGVGVTVMATPTEGEALLHNYTFDRWSANDGEYIFSDTVISAYFNVTDKLFNLKFEAVGGGMLLDCSKGTTDYSFNFLII